MEANGEKVKEIKKIDGTDNVFSFISPNTNITYLLTISIINGQISVSLNNETINQIFESYYDLQKLHEFRCLVMFETIDEILDELKHIIENGKFLFSKKENGIELSFIFSTHTKDILVPLTLSKIIQENVDLIEILTVKLLDLQKQVKYLTLKLEEKNEKIEFFQEFFEKQIYETSLMKKRFEQLENQVNQNSLMKSRIDELENQVYENSLMKLSIEQLEIEVNQEIKKDILKLEHNMEQAERHYSKYYKNSEIIEENDIPQLEKWLMKDLSCLSMLYNSRIDGDNISSLHSKCYNMGSTLILIKSQNNRRFGGYTSVGWEIRKSNKNDFFNLFTNLLKYKADEEAFLFSLSDHKRIDIDHEKKHNALCNEKKCGPGFGISDLRIGDSFCTEVSSFSKLKNTYGTCDNSLTEYFLTGSEFFKIKKLEVYKIN
jgi:hypothetical protein